jgi:26S proteasome regulatory subunit N5
LTSQYSGANAFGEPEGELGEGTSRIEEDQPGVLEREGVSGALAAGLVHACECGADWQDMKLKYYDLIVQLALQDDNYLEACSAYQEVWDTEEIKKDEGREINVSHLSQLV